MANQFPTDGINTDETLLEAVNTLATSLNGLLNADANGNNGSVDRITVASTANFPNVGFIIISDITTGENVEVISYTSKNATQFIGITRGADGTVTLAHATGSVVKNGNNAAYHNYMREAQISVEDMLSLYKDKFNLRPLVWVANDQVRIEATASMPAKFMASGLYGGKDMGFYLAGSNQKLMENTANDVMDMDDDLDAGSEVANNWYAIIACDDGSGGFVLKAVTFIRVYANAAGVISCGTHLNAGAVEDYSLTDDDYNGNYFLVLTGTDKGKIGIVDDTDTSGGASRIHFSETLTNVAQGDWIMIAPKGYTNFRYIGSIYNDASGNIRLFRISGNLYEFLKVTLVAGGMTVGSNTFVGLYSVVSPIAHTVKVCLLKGTASTIGVGPVSALTTLDTAPLVMTLNNQHGTGEVGCDAQGVWYNTDNTTSGVFGVVGYRE